MKTGIEMKRFILVMATLAWLSAFGQFKPGMHPDEEEKEITMQAACPEIPTSITFAGQKTDLDRIDLAERMDRELISVLNGHTLTLLTIKRANRYFPVMAPILKAQNVPTDFLYLACTESNLNPRALSPAKAAGFWQLLAGTAREYGLEVNEEVDERYDVELSTVAACKYLKSAYKRYGDWLTVAASYNAGMGRISGELSKQMQKRSIDLYLTEETSRYVFRLFAYKLLLENPGNYNFKLRADQLYFPVEYTVVEVKGAVPSWAEWASKHGISYARLREANEWIRSTKLTNKAGKTYKVRLPKAESLSRSKMKKPVYNQNWIK